MSASDWADIGGLDVPRDVAAAVELLAEWAAAEIEVDEDVRLAAAAGPEAWAAFLAVAECDGGEQPDADAPRPDYSELEAEWAARDAVADATALEAERRADARRREQNRALGLTDGAEGTDGMRAGELAW